MFGGVAGGRIKLRRAFDMAGRFDHTLSVEVIMQAVK